MTSKPYQRWSTKAVIRVLWAVVSCFAVESIIFGISVLPAVLFWEWHLHWDLPGPSSLRVTLLSMVFIPAYLLFALSLTLLSAVSTRVLGWRAPPDQEMPINNPSWPLLDWVRYSVSMHMVRIFAGPVFRATPIWTFYLRLNGAQLGRRVFVNSLWVMDHNLLEFGNDVVIGSEVHLSGHTVEAGMVKTARIRLGAGVTVGASSIVGIGVEAGPGCQIGAMSLVPKFTRLEAGKTYAGIPVHPIESHKKAEAE